MPTFLPSYATLDAVLHYHAQRTPDAEIAVEDRERLTYRTANQYVDRYCQWLDDCGIREGDRVALLAPPGISYLLMLMASSRLGAIYVGVNPRYSRDEIAHVLAVTQPKLLVYAPAPGEDDLGARAMTAAGEVTVLAAPRIDTLPSSAEPRLSPAAPADVAVVVFTSGSTGRPKGAALHHSGLIGAAVSQYDHLDGEPRRYLSNLPINHVGAIMNTTMGCLVGGGTLVFQAKFDPAGVLDLIENEQVGTWLQVPAMFTLVVNRPDFERRDLSSLRSICIGGGAVSAPTLARLRSIGAKVFVEYGQTEVMSSLAYSDDGATDEVLLNSIGRFDLRFETRIADEAGQICESGEIGEIQARGDCVLRCYWGDEVATRDAFTPDGWLKTGDLAMERPDGNISLKGRLREMIKSGGYNVYPREVEAIIEGFPAVAEVVVYAVPDPVYGEAVWCTIECNTGVPITTDELKTYCANYLANYKIPKNFLFAAALPRLNNGKIDRAAVRKAGQDRVDV